VLCVRDQSNAQLALHFPAHQVEAAKRSWAEFVDLLRESGRFVKALSPPPNPSWARLSRACPWYFRVLLPPRSSSCLEAQEAQFTHARYLDVGCSGRPEKTSRFHQTGVEEHNPRGTIAAQKVETNR
jgi:hypothetical protein